MQIFCAKCGSKDLSANNDIILCDGTCDRGFHQHCLEPPLLSEDSNVHITNLMAAIPSFSSLVICQMCFPGSVLILHFLLFFKQFPLMMRVGYALDVIAKLTALTYLMTLKEQIFLSVTVGRSMINPQVLLVE